MQSNFQQRSICGEVCLELIVMPGASDDMEIQNIHDISIMIGPGVGKAIHVNLDRFKDPLGRSVADVIMADYDRLTAILAAQEKAEREHEEYDRAGDELEARLRE